MDGGRVFVDRRDAGRQLAEELHPYAENAVVLGLPRGGIVVAREVADALGIPLDVAISCKLRHPDMPEFAAGAVDPEGHLLFNPDAVGTFSPEAMDAEVAQRAALARKRLAQYRAIHAEVPVAGRTVLLVDDGMATGLTIRLAAPGLPRKGAAKVVVALPVAPRDAQDRLRNDVDECVILVQPVGFHAVGQAYLDFAQVEDDEALAAFR